MQAGEYTHSTSIVDHVLPKILKDLYACFEILIFVLIALALSSVWSEFSVRTFELVSQAIIFFCLFEYVINLGK